MNTFLERIISSAKAENISLLEDSRLFKDQEDYSPTILPALNVALSGKFSGGLTSGTTLLAGPSRNGKTLLGLVLCKAYLDKHPDAAMVFLDSEGGVNTNYFSQFEIEMDRIIHIPITNIEEVKFTVVNILEEVKYGEHLVFFFDSIGNAASIKELEDAKDNKSKADMSRAKALKSFFRIVTPYLINKNLPFIGINHTYSSQDSFFPSEIMSGGQGPLLSANTVFFMGKSKEKDGTELSGFNFKVKAYKSRTIREGSVFTINIDFNQGIDKNSDMFEAALDGGYIQKSGNSYVFAAKYGDSSKYKKSAFKFKDPSDKIWNKILNDPEFIQFYEQRYSLSGSQSEESAEIILDSSPTPTPEITLKRKKKNVTEQ